MREVARRAVKVAIATGGAPTIAARRTARHNGGMHDDDDWVGTPPEGRYTRDRAKPEFWWSQRPPQIVAGLLVAVVIAVVVIALAR